MIKTSVNKKPKAPSFYITEKEMDLGVGLLEEALSKALKKP